MTFEADASDSDRLRRRALIVAMSAGVLLIVCGAISYLLHLDRPRYRLKALEPLVVVSYRPDTGRRQPVRLEFQNVGRKPLRLDQIQTTCSCTVAGAVQQAPIAPGEIVGVELSVTLPARGDQVVRIAVRTLPPCEAPVEVVLTLHGGELPVPAIRRMPAAFQVVTTRPRETVEYDFSIETHELIDAPKWVTGMHVVDERAVAEVTSTDDVQVVSGLGLVVRRYGVLLKAIGPDSPVEPLMLTIRPEVNEPTAEEIKPLTVSVAFRPPFRASPERVLVTPDEVSTMVSKPIVIYSKNEGVPVPRITDVATGVDWISARVRPAEDGAREQRILLTVSHPTSEANALADLVIQIDSDPIAELHVPVLWSNHLLREQDPAPSNRPSHGAP